MVMVVGRVGVVLGGGVCMCVVGGSSRIGRWNYKLILTRGIMGVGGLIEIS